MRLLPGEGPPGVALPAPLACCGLTLLLALAVGPVLMVKGDFEVNMSNWTEYARSAGDDGSGSTMGLIPLSYGGSAANELCGCLNPPCYTTIHLINFTCGFTGASIDYYDEGEWVGGTLPSDYSALVPAYFHPPYPYRDSETYVPVNITYEGKFEIFTGDSWSNWGVTVDRERDVFGNLIYSQRLPSDNRLPAPDDYHDPLQFNSVAPQPVTCEIYDSNVTCRSGPYHLTCLIPQYRSACAANPTDDINFPPCFDPVMGNLLTHDYCSSVNASNAMAWFESEEYTEAIRMTYGDTDNEGVGYDPYTNHRESMLRVQCSGHEVLVEPRAGLLATDPCYVQHETPGEPFCNNPDYCTAPTTCGECTYHAASDTCFSVVIPMKFGYNSLESASSVTGEACFVPTLKEETFNQERNITDLVFENAEGDLVNASLSLDGQHLERDLDFLLDHYRTIDMPINTTLEHVGLNLVHMQMAQVGLKPWTTRDLTIWTALHQLSAQTADIQCYDKSVQLMCVPTYHDLTDNCATHSGNLQNVVVDGIVMTSSVDMPGTKSAEDEASDDTVVGEAGGTERDGQRGDIKADGDAVDGRGEGTGKGDPTWELLDSRPNLRESFEKAMREATWDQKHKDEEYEYEYEYEEDDYFREAAQKDVGGGHGGVAQQKGDYDEESIELALDNELSRHACTGPYGNKRYAYCMTIDSGDDVNVVCSTPHSYIICPVSKGGVSVFDEQINATTPSTSDPNTTAMAELSLTCSFQPVANSCDEELLYTNEYPISRNLSSFGCLVGWEASPFPDPFSYCADKCANAGDCLAFWVGSLTNGPDQDLGGACCLYSSYDVDTAELGVCDRRSTAQADCLAPETVVMDSKMGTGHFYSQSCSAEQTAVGASYTLAAQALEAFSTVFNQGVGSNATRAATRLANTTAVYANTAVLSVAKPITDFDADNFVQLLEDQFVYYGYSLKEGQMTSEWLRRYHPTTGLVAGYWSLPCDDETADTCMRSQFAFAVKEVHQHLSRRNESTVVIEYQGTYDLMYEYLATFLSLPTSASYSTEDELYDWYRLDVSAAYDAEQAALYSSSPTAGLYTPIDEWINYRWHDPATTITRFNLTETFDLTCTMSVPVDEWHTDMTASLSKNATLAAALTTDDMSCPGQRYAPACAGMTVARTAGLPPPLATVELGDIYSITTGTKYHTAYHLHKATGRPERPVGSGYNELMPVPDVEKEDSCDMFKLRLTDEVQFERSGVWYPYPQDLGSGFVTEFDFQYTRPSRMCKSLLRIRGKDKIYSHCRDEGADGLALVVMSSSGWDEVQARGDGTAPLGRDGDGLAYAGLPQALAIEFDTFPNPANGEPVVQHVSAHSMGTDTLTSDGDSHIASWSLSGMEYPRGFLDGAVHKARVEYWPSFLYQNIIRSTSSSAHALNLTTNEATYEPDRLVEDPPQSGPYKVFSPTTGTVNVFLDDMKLPIFSFPIDLGKLGFGDDGAGYVGITAATGRRWQKSYLLDWRLCEGTSCGQYVADKNVTEYDCETGTTQVDYTGKRVRNHRRCNFWNTNALHDKRQSVIMPNYLHDTTSEVETDPDFVPQSPWDTPLYENPEDIDEAYVKRLRSPTASQDKMSPSFGHPSTDYDAYQHMVKDIKYGPSYDAGSLAAESVGPGTSFGVASSTTEGAVLTYDGSVGPNSFDLSGYDFEVARGSSLDVTASSSTSVSSSGFSSSTSSSSTSYTSTTSTSTTSSYSYYSPY